MSAIPVNLRAGVREYVCDIPNSMSGPFRTNLGPVNTCFATALLCEKCEGKAQSTGHSRPMAKLCNAAPAFFRAQPGGMGRILPSPSLLTAYKACSAARLVPRSG